MNVYGRNYTYDYPVYKTADIPYRHTLVNNTPVPGIINPETVTELADFQFQDGDIVVASYQKAGSIILRVMVQMLLGLPVMEDAFHWLEIDGPVVREHSRVRGHRLLRTHLPPEWLPLGTDKHVTFLFVYPSNPEFALSLFSHFHTSGAIGYTGDWDDFFRLWKSGKVFYGSFYRHTQSWRTKLSTMSSVVCWGQSNAKIDERVVEAAATKILKSPFHQGQSHCRSSHDNHFATTRDVITTSSSCDDIEMMSLVREVSEYLTANNPLTRWKSELEIQMLERGLDGLSLEHRKFLKEEGKSHKIEEGVFIK